MTHSTPARGYISSGEFRGKRAPQHIQNQIIKLYCDSNNFEFVLSRAEYWINGSTSCQLWAALKEGFKHIVLYSIWQLPSKDYERFKVYDYCLKHKIRLHFATEQLTAGSSEGDIEDLENIIGVQDSISREIDYDIHFETLKSMLMQ